MRGMRTGKTSSCFQPSSQLKISRLEYVSSHHLLPGLHSSLVKETICEEQVSV